jgi:D-alanyl-D-alanine carboxypeptidase/D-alanyl-D-alanine-endopeptidase (penicillin-binding protein 4)
MTPKQLNPSITLILLLAIVASSLPFTVAQDRGGNRPRVTNQTPSPTPTPSPSPTPEQVAPSQQTQRITNNTTTLPELQNRIVEILRKPELSSAMVGIKVASLDSGRVLFEENANKLLRPASNMKLYTVATALDKLSPEFRFTTSVYAPARPDAAGIVHGDLTIYGRGDPSIAARFNSGDYFKGIEELASRVTAAGVKRVEGDILGDETYFTGPQYGSGWEWEDLQWWYGAEISALTVNDNALDLYVKPGAKVGAPAVITTGPPDPLLTIMNHVTTAPSGTKRQLTIYRGLGTHALEIVGTMALDDRGFTGGIGISHPALLFIYLLRSALAKRGVVITGRSRTIGPSVSGAPIGAAPISGLTEIVTFQSPPLSVIAAQTLKPSQNLYTELILRTLGRVVPAPESSANDNPTSESAGLDVVRGFLKEAGINPAALVLSDGSGLSRNDMITAEATLQLLTYMSRHTHANVFRDALPVAGVDGTLRNRMRGTLADNNLRAKTGSLSSAASLSGYLTTAAGERLVFSIIVNNYPEDLEPRVVCIDPIAVLLASFAGKS